MEHSQKVFFKTILLHACCGICSSYPISYLKDTGYDVVVYFYNPNIYPASEYQKRLEAEKTLCAAMNCKLIEGIYEPEVYLEYIKGLENEPEKGLRCNKCFELRLQASAKLAKELGINLFTTSIGISPHKNYEKLTRIAEKTAQEHRLEYLAVNFRKNDGFLKTNKISKGLNLYRQNYCGCKFAMKK